MEETWHYYINGELIYIAIYEDLIGESWWMNYTKYPVE